MGNNSSTIKKINFEDLQKILSEFDNNKKEYHHFDFYRVEDELELDYIGFHDIIENSTDLIFIEWPDKFLDTIKKYNHRTINIYFNFIEDNINVREVQIS